MMSFAGRDVRPHPEERACGKSFANAKARTRVSKDGDERLGSPSCFETHRGALGLWKHLRSHPAAMLLSMRARGRRISAKRSQAGSMPVWSARTTNLRLCEMTVGVVSLFADCYLQ